MQSTVVGGHFFPAASAPLCVHSALLWIQPTHALPLCPRTSERAVAGSICTCAVMVCVQLHTVLLNRPVGLLVSRTPPGGVRCVQSFTAVELHSGATVTPYTADSLQQISRKQKNAHGPLCRCTRPLQHACMYVYVVCFVCCGVLLSGAEPVHGAATVHAPLRCAWVGGWSSHYIAKVEGPSGHMAGGPPAQFKGEWGQAGTYIWCVYMSVRRSMLPSARAFRGNCRQRHAGCDYDTRH